MAKAPIQEQPGLWQQSDLLGLSDAGTAAQPSSAPRSATPPSTAALGPSPPAAAAAPASPAPAAPPRTDVTAPPRPASVSLPACAMRGARSALPIPETLLLLDTETTGLSPLQGQCIEVGAILFHVPLRAVLTQVSFLLPCSRNDAEAINGIPAAVTRVSQPWQEALGCFLSLVEACDALVAHNASFDRQWFGIAPLPVLDRPWICSMEDIRWPAERHLRATPSVRDLALAYGVPVWAAHRALTDCLYLAQVFERCTDLESLLQAALEPRSLYRADLPYAERQRAREAGFRWNEAVPRAWSRRLSRREAEALPFPVQLVAETAPPEALARHA